MTADETVRTVGTVIVSTGLGGFLVRELRDWRNRRRNRRTDADRVREDIDGNILTVVKARDELEADNGRLRDEIRETNTRHAHDRAEWSRERTALRAEIEHLEAKLRALLDEVTDLKTRHGI